MRVSTFICDQSAYLQWRISSNVKVLDTYRISAYTATRTVGVKLRRNIEDQNGSVSRKRTLEFCPGISESRKILISGPTDLTGSTPDLEMTFVTFLPVLPPFRCYIKSLFHWDRLEKQKLSFLLSSHKYPGNLEISWDMTEHLPQHNKQQKQFQYDRLCN